MRWLQYLAFGLAFIGAQACAADDLPAPPLTHASGPIRAGQASTDGSGDGSSDPGQGDTQGLDSQQGTPLDPPECTVTYTQNILPKIRDQDKAAQTQCARFTTQGCKETIPPCEPPAPAARVSGMCN